MQQLNGGKVNILPMLEPDPVISFTWIQIEVRITTTETDISDFTLIKT